jgi:hypothetical protein
MKDSRGRERKPGPGPDPNWPAAIEQCDCAELARLRAIEEAARAVAADYPSDAWPVLNALRAALGEKP